MQLTIGHLLAALTDYEVTGNEPPITSAQVDSRAISAGDLFFAFAGERVDGHDFVTAAFENGAVAAIVERPVDATGGRVIDVSSTVTYSGETIIQLVVDDCLAALHTITRYWRAQFPQLKVVGITGSVGKTTTKELVASVVGQTFNVLKSPANWNSKIGIPLTLLGLRSEHEVAVLELGMLNVGDIALLCDLARPHIGVVTLVGKVHLERVGSMDNLVAGKREIVESLPADGYAVLNDDEPLVRGMADYASAPVLRYGLSAGADIWADNIDSDGLRGIRFDLRHAGETLRVALPLLGRHSVQTALRAAAVGHLLGMTWDEIVVGMRSHSDELRLVVATGPHGSVILDDTYNASPASMLAALNLLADLDGRRVAVLGDMLELGSAEIESHQMVGYRACEVAELLITVGELAPVVADAALERGFSAANLHTCATPDEAIPLLEQLIEADDVILIKGSRGVRLDRIAEKVVVRG